ncbi:hypothetical protein K450DRAFT_253619 [Umbelopsis ramanniana AG]|uniref:Uncharacterized protein n=1 Tax=Umbelopsis ramanniana AG TaxID=1314678 RepID=A0AAD5HAH5_UMBRA|nr:uncharacterized protein K450DRAFT_253619 [Umbelopsis ramanniana AG]KAI8577095.1 hypothetical protein K450DRAFT_253619 [Umbelopsis ramanniana AG]
MSSDAAFQAFDHYDFDKDDRFQAGLPSLLKNQEGKTESERLELIQRARWFYYTKFVQAFDYTEYQQWKINRNPTDNNISDKQDDPVQAKDSSTDDNETPKRLTFQEIVERIEKGEEIPGIKQIPNKLNEAAPSEAKLSARPKPWEVQQRSSEAIDSSSGTNDENVNSNPTNSHIL